MSKQNISIDEATFLVAVQFRQLDSSQRDKWLRALASAQETKNALMIDMREFGVADAVLLQAIIWAAQLNNIKVVTQPLPSSFKEGAELVSSMAKCDGRKSYDKYH